MITHYDTLKVTRDADDEVIDSAYRALMKKYHPDKTNGDHASTERAKLINAAYSTLRDPDARNRYDRTLTPVESDVGFEPKQPSPPEPTYQTPTTPPRSSSAKDGSWLTSLAFISLAVTVAVGAFGSFGKASPDQPATASISEADTNAVDGNPPKSSDRAGERPDRSEARAAPVAVTAPEAEKSAIANCNSAPTAVAYVICADPEVADADARLRAAFSARLQSTLDAGALRESQNAWYAKRDGLPSDRDLILQAYNDRIGVLQLGDLEGLY